MTGHAPQQARCDCIFKTVSLVRSAAARLESLGTRRFACKMRVASALLLGPALSGCILGSERPDLNLDIPANYREAQRGAPDAALPALDWWRGFRSGELTALMEAAQIYNLDIAVAVAQIVQADAQVGVTGAALLPSVTGTGTAESIKDPGVPPVSQYGLGLTASYMVDFWGKNRAALHASEENATVARYNREVVTLTAIVTVANTYFQILAAQDDQRLLLRHVELRGRSARELLLDQHQNALGRGEVAARDAQFILRRQDLEIGIGDGDDGRECDDLAIIPGDGRALLGGIQRRAVLAPEIDHVACGEPETILRDRGHAGVLDALRRSGSRQRRK